MCFPEKQCPFGLWLQCNTSTHFNVTYNVKVSVWVHSHWNVWTLVCVPVCVCVCVHVWVHVCTCVCTEARDCHQVSSWIALRLHFLRQDLSGKLEFTGQLDWLPSRTQGISTGRDQLMVTFPVSGNRCPPPHAVFVTWMLAIGTRGFVLAKQSKCAT